MEIDLRYKSLLLELLEEKRYQISLELDKLKGEPFTNERKKLTEKQSKLEALQHQIILSNT
ncbi:MAG: hypothetical protein ACI8P3_003526 [Saprospiraceae bacterium]|jgi:hypothetical protein